MRNECPFCQRASHKAGYRWLCDLYTMLEDAKAERDRYKAALERIVNDDLHKRPNAVFMPCTCIEDFAKAVLQPEIKDKSNG